MGMDLIADQERTLLVENARMRRSNFFDRSELIPVVHIQTLDGALSWMLTELETKDGDGAYGIFTNFEKSAEMRSFSLREMSRELGPSGLGVFKVHPFEPHYPASVYLHIQKVLVNSYE